MENKVWVPYVVINSHGHPDHTQGNYQFNEVYIHPLDLSAYENSNSALGRKNSYERLQKANGLSDPRKEEFIGKAPTKMTEMLTRLQEFIGFLDEVTQAGD